MDIQTQMNSNVKLRMERMETYIDGIAEQANKHLKTCEKLDKELVGNREKLDEYDKEYRKLRDEEDILIKRQREIDKLKDSAKNKRRNLVSSPSHAMC
jgi:DNA anti-recombination protein RmuC